MTSRFFPHTATRRVVRWDTERFEKYVLVQEIGYRYEVNQDHVRKLAGRAVGNKSKRARNGPVTVHAMVTAERREPYVEPSQTSAATMDAPRA